MSVPEVITPPEVTQTNGMLICGQGTWTGEPFAFMYQWRRNGTNIRSHAIKDSSYNVAPADGGEEFDCVVYASNADGDGWTISNALTASVPARREA